MKLSEYKLTGHIRNQDAILYKQITEIIYLFLKTILMSQNPVTVYNILNITHESHSSVTKHAAQYVNSSKYIIFSFIASDVTL